LHQLSFFVIFYIILDFFLYYTTMYVTLCRSHRSTVIAIIVIVISFCLRKFQNCYLSSSSNVATPRSYICFMCNSSLLLHDIFVFKCMFCFSFMQIFVSWSFFVQYVNVEGRFSLFCYVFIFVVFFFACLFIWYNSILLADVTYTKRTYRGWIDLKKKKYDDGNLIIWCYELMFWFILMFLLCILTVGEVCTTFLGQLGSKLDFWGDFGVSSRERVHFLGSLLLSISLREICVPWRDVLEQHMLFCTSQAFGVVSGHP